MSGCYRELNAGLVVPIFIHIIRDFPVLLFAFLGGSHFYTYNSGFPCAFICLSFMLMSVDFSRTEKGYSIHLLYLHYIVTDLEAGQYFVGRFQNLDYMHY